MMSQITNTKDRKVGVEPSPLFKMFAEIQQRDSFVLQGDRDDEQVVTLDYQETVGVASELVRMLCAFAENDKTTPEAVVQQVLGAKVSMVYTLRSALGPDWKTRVVRALNDYTIDELAAIAINDSLASYDFMRTQTREDLIGRVLGGIERQDTAFRRSDHFVILASGGQVMVSE